VSGRGRGRGRGARARAWPSWGAGQLARGAGNGRRLACVGGAPQAWGAVSPAAPARRLHPTAPRAVTTPDLTPLCRTPQRVKAWIQAVFVDKRFYDADAPVPTPPASRRASSGAGDAPSGGGGASGGGAAPGAPVRQLSGAGARSVGRGGEGAAAVATALGMPPVRDVKDLLGPKAITLQVGWCWVGSGGTRWGG
jgi:hypothetical protein